MADTYITLADLPKLKKEYTKTTSKNQTSFIYKDQELLVSYTKYLIQYLESLKQN